jgi:hypothetical protein
VKVPWRQHEWQKHCLIIPSAGGDDAHCVLYAPATDYQRTLFNASGQPKWNEKMGEGVLYALPYWDNEEDALDALARAAPPPNLPAD